MVEPILPHNSKLRYTKRGVIFGAEFGTVTGADVYEIRIEATDRVTALLFALGVEFRYVCPEQDSGRAWYETKYSDAPDVALIELIDFCADVRFNKPNFGQLVLFDDGVMPHG